MNKLLTGLVFLLLVTVINVPTSSGFPWIFARFRVQYLAPNEAGEEDDAFKDQVREANCYVCHDSAHPRTEEGWEQFHNAYGEALEDVLGDPDALLERFKDRSQRDELFAEIDAAIQEVGGQDSGDGRTFGEILESGELPVPPAEGTQSADDE